MGHSGKDLGVIAILLAATALVYANSLQNPFVVDDQHIVVRNLLLRQWTLADIMRSHLFAPLGAETQYYRPLTLLTFAINYTLFELNPTGYHIFNLTAHLVVVVLLYLLFSLFVTSWVAGFAAALFALHPANVQAVTYISSRSDPLYAIFTLLSLLLWFRAAQQIGPKSAAFRASSVLCFFVGLFAKETAIITLPLVVLTDSIRTDRRKWRQDLHIGWYLVFAAALILYIAIRVGLAGYALSMEGSRESWRGGGPGEMTARILLALKLVYEYVALAIYPLNLSFFRDFAVPEGPLEAGVVAGITTVIVLAGLAIFFFRPRKEISYGVLWFLIAIFPVLNLTSLNAPIMEHWLYLPLAGLAIAFVSGVRILGAYLGESRGATVGLGLLLILLSAKTISRNAEWGDPIRLFQSDARRYPNEEKNWFLLGYAYFERGIPNQAIHAYKAGLAINPNHAYGWSGLAEALSMARKDDEAEKSFLRAIAIMPENPWFHYALGVERLKTGKVDGAIETLQRAVISNPPLPLAYHVLGSAYLRQGKADEADRAFSRALAMLPRAGETHAAVHIELGKLYMEVGKERAAQEEWRLALRFDANNAQAKSFLESQLP